MHVEWNFEKRYRLVREIIETLILTVFVFLVINMAIQNYDVDGPSMEPRLHNQERIMVDKWSYLFHEPARSDIVVFIAPPDPQNFYVKRIIGVPGDRITIHDTTVIVDGVTLKETYVQPENQGNPGMLHPIENMLVPANDFFVLGDNRANSSDSRTWGFVPRKNIIGRAALVYWPLHQDNYGLLPDYSSVFARVHQSGQKLGSLNSSLLSVSMMMPGFAPVLLFPGRRRRRQHRHRSYARWHPSVNLTGKQTNGRTNIRL
ncbi:MAG TPA: signal peptidase I [Ktedonobacteraceae bacterium]|nr:signal peptidase I [Ktedonobacteraceae bacterium]